MFSRAVISDAKTRGGGGERRRCVPFFPATTSFPRSRALFLLGLFRDAPIIWGPGTGYVLETVLHTGVSLIRCRSLASSVSVLCLVSPNGCRELNYRMWLLSRTWNFYFRLMLVSFSAFCLSYIVVWLKVSVKLFRQFLGVWSFPELTDRYELYLNR